MGKTSILKAPVAVSECKKYDKDIILDELRIHFEKLGFDRDFFKGKKVVIKPNLVAAKKPELAVTTHPSVVHAVYELLCELGVDGAVLAESPGGPYSGVFLSRVYNASGMTSLSEKTGLKLNYDVTYSDISFSNGGKLKTFDVITPVKDADIVINVCKLKTHSLTGLSCAVKNLFGVVPGTHKFEMHAAYSSVEDFCEMLTDLNLSLYQDKDIITVCDAVVSMEGNGPTHGTPVDTGLILTSASTFALDAAAEKIIGLEDTAVCLKSAVLRGVLNREWVLRNTAYGDISKYENMNLKMPDSKRSSFLMKILINLPDFMGGRLKRFFEPRPEINPQKCIGCGNCADVCPKKTITIESKKGKKLAKIDKSRCIRCYCCQELCPVGAVDTRKNPLFKLVH